MIFHCRIRQRNLPKGRQLENDDVTKKEEERRRICQKLHEENSRQKRGNLSQRIIILLHSLFPRDLQEKKLSAKNLKAKSSSAVTETGRCVQTCLSLNLCAIILVFSANILNLELNWNLRKLRKARVQIVPFLPQINKTNYIVSQSLRDTDFILHCLCFKTVWSLCLKLPPKGLRKRRRLFTVCWQVCPKRGSSLQMESLATDIPLNEFRCVCWQKDNCRVSCHIEAVFILAVKSLFSNISCRCSFNNNPCHDKRFISTFNLSLQIQIFERPQQDEGVKDSMDIPFLAFLSVDAAFNFFVILECPSTSRRSSWSTS